MKPKIYNRTTKPVGLIYDHIIFHVKYNRKVLKNTIQKRCEEIIRIVLEDLGCECVEINVQPNHVHILVGIPLNITPSNVVLRVKGTSSFHLRKEFPILKQQIKKALWSPSCVHSSVGNDMKAVRVYINHQDSHHRGGREKT